MKISLTNNLGLKIIAIILAVAVYYAIKLDSTDTETNHDERRILKQH